MRHADNGMAEYIFHSRYSRPDPQTGRRETFDEAVGRVAALHRERFAPVLQERLEAALPDALDSRLRLELGSLLDNTTVDALVARAFAAVSARRVLPSLRSLQYAGEPLRRHPARMFNCAFSPVDRLAFFREYFYLLLCGTGCGFSVQFEHLALLPPLPIPGPTIVDHRVADTIDGWADAVGVLVAARFAGSRVIFDYSEIRRRGEPLHTSGGFAPGAEPLRHALVAIDRILAAAAGRRLRPIEVYDLCMHVARAVLGGGGRRSASICLFSPEDEEMARAKTGDWQRLEPWRTTSNNSAVILRCVADRTRFRHLCDLQRAFGEPGFYFTDHPDYGCNPCGEAGLHPVFAPPHPADLEAFLRERGWKGAWDESARLSGWQMCNLTTVNGAAARDAAGFLEAVLHATVIGTLQAAYTDIAPLGPVTRALNDRDALLGVSICGLMDNPALLLDPRLLEAGAKTARAVNAAVAAVIGVRPAARLTCIKPEGTASLLLGTSAGIHPYPHHRYFRRVRARREDPVFAAFASVNPEMVEASVEHPATEACVVFPVKAPPSAEVRDQDGALSFFERVRFVQRHWVLPGEAPEPRSPGLHHNVSHSCPVRRGEWAAVADYLWANREDFSGVALFGDRAASRYPQPPIAPAHTSTDAHRWNRLACRPVDYSATPASRPPPAVVCIDGGCRAD